MPLVSNEGGGGSSGQNRGEQRLNRSRPMPSTCDCRESVTLSGFEVHLINRVHLRNVSHKKAGRGMMNTDGAAACLVHGASGEDKQWYHNHFFP